MQQKQKQQQRKKCLFFLAIIVFGFTQFLTHYIAVDDIIPQTDGSTSSSSSSALLLDDSPRLFLKDGDGNNNSNKLRAPYRIIQMGDPRTGSTYQYQLLCSIIQMKNNSSNNSSPPGAKCDFIFRDEWTNGSGNKKLLSAIQGGRPFLYKMHPTTINKGLKNLLRDGTIGLFSSISSSSSSGGDGGGDGVGGGGRGLQSSSSVLVDDAIYVQYREKLEKCPTCEVKKYQSFFDLSNEEVRQLERHMSLYTIIRQCCGLQMSKYEILRLNGCDVSNHFNKPDYPHCERHDLEKTEQEFAESPIPYTLTNSEYNWAKPGDCKRFSDKISNERVGFNGRAVTSCNVTKIIGERRKRRIPRQQQQQQPKKKKNMMMTMKKKKEKGEKKKEPTAAATIIEPPYQIIQMGSARTGSTYQYQLLCSIIQMKNNYPSATATATNSPPQCDLMTRSEIVTGNRLVGAITGGHSFVFKLHYQSPDFMKIVNNAGGRISIFSSGGVGQDDAIYIQHRERLEECPTCEIKQYQPFFNLTDREVRQLEQHMSLYTIIRQCCGLQMSKYEVLRLNGCDVSKYINKPDYPHCERHDLEKTEQEFAESPIPYTLTNSEYNWAKPGDCKRFSDKIRKEKVGFNGRAVTSCEVKKFIGINKK